MGLSRQDRFAILSKNSIEYIELYGAAETAGYIAVAINYRLSADEMAYIVNDSAPKVLFFEEEFAQIVERIPRQSAGHRFICLHWASARLVLSYENWQPATGRCRLMPAMTISSI